MLYHADYKDILPEIKDGSIDMILVDPPYNILKEKWDIKLDFDFLWIHINRIIKEKGAIVFFGQQPFTSQLIASNYKGFKYCWTWDKSNPSQMLNAKHRPLQQSEDIIIFSQKGKKINYYPQMVEMDEKDKHTISFKNTKHFKGSRDDTRKYGTNNEFTKTYTHRYPTTLIKFLKVMRGSVHPTQKPVLLLEYLIKTYTLEGETVLDFTMGSGSTGVATKNTNRDFIGIENDLDYFNIAQERIDSLWKRQS